MRHRAAFLVLALLGSGCVDFAEEDVAGQERDKSNRPVVVALLDTGITPYLPIFASQAPLPSFLIGQVRTFDFAPDGTYEERLESDANEWESATTGELYWFPGTRLLGISFEHDAVYKMLDRQIAVHGTATSYLVARDAPNVLIVGIQVAEQFSPTTPYLVDPTVADAMEWVADQDWIDVVSISKGFIGNPPSKGELDPIALRYVRASERAAASGKVIVNAAGNAAVPSLSNPFNGPPWIITVGGSNHHGEPADASKLVDVVANYSEIVPKPWTVNETSPLHGTSMATPIVAATIATAIESTRAGDPSFRAPAQSYRDALNATAIYFGPMDWDPPMVDPTDPIGTISEHSYPIIAQSQMGWGFIDASMATEIARRVMENDTSLGGKEQASIFQTRWQDAREEYWDKYAS